MRSPLTETINRVQGMIKYAQENLSEDEYLLFLDLLAPETEKSVTKKPRKKRTGSKSPRAASLRQQISGTTIQRCTAEVDGKVCNEPQGHALHEDSTYANYHPFASSSPVANAGGRSSSKKGTPATSAASSETARDDAASAAAGSGGD